MHGLDGTLTKFLTFLTKTGKLFENQHAFEFWNLDNVVGAV